MTEREKVIKAIDICLGRGKCDDCGYRIKGGYSTMDCRKQMMRDALAMLKEQEPAKVRHLSWAKVALHEKIVFEDVCENCSSYLLKHWKACPNCGKQVKWE